MLQKKKKGENINIGGACEKFFKETRPPIRSDSGRLILKHLEEAGYKKEMLILRKMMSQNKLTIPINYFLRTDGQPKDPKIIVAMMKAHNFIEKDPSKAKRVGEILSKLTRFIKQKVHTARTWRRQAEQDN